MSVASNGTNLCSSRVGERDKSSTAKLPSSAAGEMLLNADNAGLSLTGLKLQHSWSSAKAFLAEYIDSEDIDLGLEKEHVESDGFQYVGWTDLMDIPLYSLHAFFKTAVETISHEGYTEDAVIHAIGDSALCYQFDGPITKIADRALAMLKSGQQVDSPLRGNLDMHLHMLGLYILCGASSLLKNYFPFFTRSDALWCIMLCDMDISIAHAFSVDINSYGKEQSDCLVVNNQNVNDTSGSYSYSASESPGGAALAQSEQVKNWRASLSQSPERTWSKVLTDYIATHKSSGIDHVSSSGQDHVSSSGQEHACSAAQLEKSSSLARTVVMHNKKAAKGTSSKRTLKESGPAKAFIKSDHVSSSGQDHVSSSAQEHACYSGQLEKSSSLARTVVTHNKRAAKGTSIKRSLKESRLVKAFLESDHVSSSGQDRVSSSGHEHACSSSQLEKSSSLARTVVTHNKKAAKGTSSKRTLKDSRSVKAFLESASSTSKAAKGSYASFRTIMPVSCLSLLKSIDPSTVVSVQPISSPVNHSSSSSSTGKTVTKQQTEPGGLIRFSLPNTPVDGFEFEFSHDGMRTSWVPKDRKEEMALGLIRRLGELKLEVKAWADWASERLMQSVKRLAVEQPFLASLRQEKEKETFECGVLVQKLQETKKSICDISVELDRANSLELKLADKVELSKRERDSAKLQEEQSAARFADILRKESVSCVMLKSIETEKILLQEELTAERSKLRRLLENLEHTERYNYVLKKRLEGGEKMMDEAMKQVDLERNEVERIKMSARREYNNVLVNAENEKKRLQASAKELHQRVKGLEFDVARARPQRLAVSMGPPAPGLRPDSVQQERECQMCLDEDVAVVFLPCGHQIVCISCNQLLQDKGVPNCPFCRLPIQQSICARFSDS